MKLQKVIHTKDGSSYKWIDDEFHYNKECVVCHMQGGYERHKNLDGYAFYKSGDGTWYHYTGCSVCGWPGTIKDYEECDTIWKSISDSKHVKKCRICEHEEEFLHEFKYAYVELLDNCFSDISFSLIFLINSFFNSISRFPFNKFEISI